VVVCPNSTQVVLARSSWGWNNTCLYLCSISLLSETRLLHQEMDVIYSL